MVPSNWWKSMIDLWSIISINFPMTYFHFFDEYKDQDTGSSKKNVLIFNFRIISTHIEGILFNSSETFAALSSLLSLILLTLVEFRLETGWTITFLQSDHLYIDDGNVTVSRSHPSLWWHIPTRWEYDWWEYTGSPWWWWWWKRIRGSQYVPVPRCDDE